LHARRGAIAGLTNYEAAITTKGSADAATALVQMIVGEALRSSGRQRAWSHWRNSLAEGCHAIRRRLLRLALGGRMLCSAIFAQCLHRAAMSLQVALLGGWRVTFAICSQSIACRRNSSDACIGLLFQTAPDPSTTISYFISAVKHSFETKHNTTHATTE